MSKKIYICIILLWLAILSASCNKAGLSSSTTTGFSDYYSEAERSIQENLPAVRTLFEENRGSFIELQEQLVSFEDMVFYSGEEGISVGLNRRRYVNEEIAEIDETLWDNIKAFFDLSKATYISCKNNVIEIDAYSYRWSSILIIFRENVPTEYEHCEELDTNWYLCWDIQGPV